MPAGQPHVRLSFRPSDDRLCDLSSTKQELPEIKAAMERLEVARKTGEQQIFAPDQAEKSVTRHDQDANSKDPRSKRIPSSSINRPACCRECRAPAGEDLVERYSPCCGIGRVVRQLHHCSNGATASKSRANRRGARDSSGSVQGYMTALAMAAATRFPE